MSSATVVRGARKKKSVVAEFVQTTIDWDQLIAAPSFEVSSRSVNDDCGIESPVFDVDRTIDSAAIQPMFDFESDSSIDSAISATTLVGTTDRVHQSRLFPVSTRSSETVDGRKNNRTGKCQHVGGVMGTVLSRYGISIDALITEIERIQSASA